MAATKASKPQSGTNEPVWEKENPKKKHQKLTPAQKKKAKRSAKQHGRSKPSLVDNINAEKASKKSGAKKSKTRTSAKSS